MEERTCAPRAPHLLAGIGETNGRVGRAQTDSGLLRQRISREYRHEHHEAARFRTSLECARQLGSVEKSRTSDRQKYHAISRRLMLVAVRPVFVFATRRGLPLIRRPEISVYH